MVENGALSAPQDIFEFIAESRARIMEHAATFRHLEQRAISDKQATFCRDMAHAAGFICWLHDNGREMPFPESWQDVVADNWREAKGAPFMEGFSLETHASAVRQIIELTWPIGRPHIQGVIH